MPRNFAPFPSGGRNQEDRNERGNHRNDRNNKANERSGKRTIAHTNEQGHRSSFNPNFEKGGYRAYERAHEYGPKSNGRYSKNNERGNASTSSSRREERPNRRRR